MHGHAAARSPAPAASREDLRPFLGQAQDKDAPVLASAHSARAEFLNKILPPLLAGLL